MGELEVSKQLDALKVKVVSCVLCGLSAGRTNAVFGRGNTNADLMLIGEAPGADEDEQGLPFVGRSGQLLQKILEEEIGQEAAEGVYISNIVKCRPPNNRAPTPEEVKTCRPYLDEQIKFVSPKVIVTLGNSSTRPLLNTNDGITKIRGTVFEPAKPSSSQSDSSLDYVQDYVIVPSFHPAAIFHDYGKEKFLRQDLTMAYKLTQK